MNATWDLNLIHEMDWAGVENLDDVASPGLLVYPDRVDHNLRRMLEIVAGDPARLRPHVKTHKMSTVIQRQRELGIVQVKCATIAEAELCAHAGAQDVLLAHQPVGPHIARLAALTLQFPSTEFSTIVDCPSVVAALAAQCVHKPLKVFIDLDVGLGRTGTAPGPPMLRLASAIRDATQLEFAGLHAYDGHLHDPDPAQREAQCREVQRVVQEMADACDAPLVVAGGTPNFQFYAQQTPWQCSPGSSTLWDLGYGSLFPELGFKIAAILLTRVISRPADGRICFDLGYKAVASETPLAQRVFLPQLPDAEFVLQNEEHLVATSAHADSLQVGDPLYALPAHICPTTALHQYATVVRGGRATGETWPVEARDRRLSV